jgi:protein O-GlcNAc transferase
MNMNSPPASPFSSRVDAATAFQQAIALHRQGQGVQADALCAEALRVDPRHAGAWHLRGLIALTEGNADQGIEWIERSLSIDPDQPAAHLNLGNYLLSQNKSELALASLERALRLRADYPLALYNRGNALRDLGRYDAALASYDQALRIRSDDWRAVNNRGLVLLELKRPDDARAAFERALQLEPGALEVHMNLGATLLKLARPQQEEALECYERACRMTPQDPDAWCGRGNALLALKRPDEGTASYTHALQLKPDMIEALINRSGALQALHRPADALRDCELALRLAPHSVPALNHFGNALLALGRADEALARYDEALRLKPTAADTLMNRSTALRVLRRYRESAQCCAELLRIAPEQDYALGYLFQFRMDSCDWANVESLTKQLTGAVADRKKVVNPMTLLLIDSAPLQRVSAELFAADQWPENPSLGPCPGPTIRAAAKTRVAYVSADFGDHPVSHLLVGVLERHDRARFEVIGVSLAPAKMEPLGQRVRAAFDRFIVVTDRTDREVAMLLRELQVDIAVDLMGFTERQRLGIFAHRGAPVQAEFLGYAGTVGAAYMDYLLADAVVIPEGQEQHFIEHVVRLPHCYLPNDDRREIAAAPSRTEAGLPEEGFVFCAFTNACKINPPVFATWMRLLRELPGSILWLRDMGPEARENLQREAERHAVDRHRLVFAPWAAGMAEHLARLSCADLYLDTMPYNAHSTACDMLWSGVPVITCAGQCFASRVASSVLTAAGLPELITRTLEEYECKAAELARHPAKLQAIRARLAAHGMRVPLFDTGRFTRYLETAYETMQERAVRGEAPTGFTVSPSPL